MWMKDIGYIDEEIPTTYSINLTDQLVISEREENVWLQVMIVAY